jgi:hypothetical protein
MVANNYTSFISIEPRYTQSVNLERDLQDRKLLDGYVIGTTIGETLGKFFDALTQSEHNLSWSMIGSYGTGKSAFVLFLLRLISSDSHLRGTASKLLDAYDPFLHKKYKRSVAPSDSRKGYITLVVTCERETIEEALDRCLVNTNWNQATIKSTTKITKLIADYTSSKSTQRKTILQLFASILGILDHEKLGVALVFDELGKVLEYTSYHSEKDDLYILQQLAELEKVNSNQKFILILILHQVFEEYTRRMSARQTNEWKKIQGRFEEVNFFETRRQIIQLTGKVIQKSSELPDDFLKLMSSCDAESLILKNEAIASGKSSISDLYQLANLALPLHPSTTLILQHIFRKIGQNQRSLFYFLRSNDVNGFLEFLKLNGASSKNNTYRIFDLYNFIESTLLSSFNEAQYRYWLVIQNALSRLGEGNEVEERLIKTIGIINLVGDIAECPSNLTFLSYACLTVSRESEIQLAIDSLATKSILLYRKYKDSYSIWEGSDIDIDKLLDDVKHNNVISESISQFIKGTILTKPFVAPRHSFLTGTIRYFDRQIIECSQLQDTRIDVQLPFIGCVIFIYYSQSEQSPRYLQLIREFSKGHPNHLLIEPQSSYDFITVLDEYSKLKWLIKNNEELNSDFVAKREIKNRIAETESRISQILNESYGFVENPKSHVNLWQGGVPQEFRGHRHLSEVLSEVCDNIYPNALCLQNELINRFKLSPTISKARRNLLVAMLNNGDKDRLSIERYPPELGIYYSLLKNTSIHRSESNRLGFYPPTLNNGVKGATGIWNAIVERFEAVDGNRVSLDSVISRLESPPYGLPEPISTILIFAVILHYDNELATYENGTFQLVWNTGLIDKFLTKPAMISVRRCNLDGTRKEVFHLIAELFGLQGGGEVVKHRLLDVLRPILKLIASLPEYTLRTKNMSTEALAVRDEVRASSEPEVLLFEKLPMALGFERLSGLTAGNPAEAKTFVSKLKSALNELSNGYDSLIVRLEEMIYEAFEVHTQQEHSRREWIVHKAGSLKGFAIDPKLGEFINRLSMDGESDFQWVEGVASFVVMKSCSGWNDGDIALFKVKLLDLVKQFQHFEALLFEHRRHSGLKSHSYRIGVTSTESPERAKVVTLSTSEEPLAESLVKKIRKSVASEDSRIILAALSKLSREYIDKDAE